MLAKDGRCKTLDASGDGYVRAETCITLLLETLAGGQTAAAILKGSAVNQARFWHSSEQAFSKFEGSDFHTAAIFGHTRIVLDFLRMLEGQCFINSIQ